MSAKKIKKVLIVERSEMGVRALDACISLGVDFVVGFSQSDSESLLVKKALKYSQNMQGSGIAYLGAEPLEESYGNISNIIETAKLWGCDAVYPGYGPLSEDYIAVKKIEKAKLIFIGPRSDVVEIFSNKLKSRELAKRNNLKLLKAFQINSLEAVARICLDGKLKFPFIIKSLFSSGGRGNYLINDDESLSKTLSVIDLSTKQYYVEEYVSGKHIELQFVVDSEKVINLGVRDCSCQVNFQKFIEECPAEISDEKIKLIERKIGKMLVNVGYAGVGTAEFIYDAKKEEYYFLEINPRIQVEVPITENFFNIDIVKTQLLIAGGEKILAPSGYLSSRHVIEARIYARDVFNDFKQSSGEISKIILPDIEGISIFSGYQTGDVMPAGYDPLILKIVSSSNSRKQAIILLEKAIQGLVIVGPKTNKELILWLISTDKFKSNKINQDYTEKAWRAYLNDTNLRIRNFLKTGNFIEQKCESEMNPDNFPNKLIYSRNGIDRDYIKELKSKRKINSNRSAFNFGKFKKGGVECIFAWWDFSYFGGTLGVEEAIGIEKCFKLANKTNLPIIMVSNSGGARQQENSFALHSMQFIVAIKKKYKVPLYINIYYGDNFGGLNASIIEQADIKIAVKGSNIGLTGVKYLSKNISNNTTENIDSTRQHYKARNLDFVTDNLEQACQQALSIFHLLFNPQRANLKRDDNDILKCDYFEDNCFKSDNEISPNLIEILDSRSRIFEKVAVLFGQFNDEELPPILGAFVTIGDKNALVLGQHVPHGDKDGKIKKQYIYPRAADYRWFRGKLRLAEKLKLPVILFGDTAGADASDKSEYEGISNLISYSLADQVDLTVPIISVNIGLCGSGGGLPFANTADFSIAYEKSLKLVSNIEIQSSIITGISKPTDKMQNDILRQLIDATAESQKKYCFIDEIIKEQSKKETMESLKDALIKGLDGVISVNIDTILSRRMKRIERIMKKILK